MWLNKIGGYIFVIVNYLPDPDRLPWQSYPHPCFITPITTPPITTLPHPCITFITTPPPPNTTPPNTTHSLHTGTDLTTNLDWTHALRFIAWKFIGDNGPPNACLAYVVNGFHRVFTLQVNTPPLNTTSDMLLQCCSYPIHTLLHNLSLLLISHQAWDTQGRPTNIVSRQFNMATGLFIYTDAIPVLVSQQSTMTHPLDLSPRHPLDSIKTLLICFRSVLLIQ